jgi:hypothetical protein
LNPRRLFQARLKTKRAHMPAGKPCKKIKKILLSGRARRRDIEMTFTSLDE